MSYIKTWVERCDEHPDHQSGMVSNGMIQARMQEEIDDLRAEIERLRAALRECACACSSIRECVSEWARDGKCPHADARTALEAKP